MSSIIESKANLAELAARLRSIAEALKRRPSDHGISAEERAHLCKEVKAIAAQLRRD